MGLEGCTDLYMTFHWGSALNSERHKGSNVQVPSLAFSTAQVYDFPHLGSH
jgi:hypothetical protein